MFVYLFLLSFHSKIVAQSSLRGAPIPCPKLASLPLGGGHALRRELIY